jgi:hypothetical protein
MTLLVHLLRAFRLAGAQPLTEMVAGFNPFKSITILIISVYRVQGKYPEIEKIIQIAR